MSFEFLRRLSLAKTQIWRVKGLELATDWWPKPRITVIPKQYWGTRWTNGSKCLHKYKCSSKSIGHGFSRTNSKGEQELECFAYGETPWQAYVKWCEIFNSWNNKRDWDELSKLGQMPSGKDGHA